MAGKRPYVGLRSFEVEDRSLFYGRSGEARAIQELWQANRLVVLYGQSGVGKTSLLRAGVLPLLDDAAADILPVGRVSRDTTFPTAADPDLNPYVFALLSSWSPRVGSPALRSGLALSPALLSGMTITAFLRNLLARRDRFDESTRLYGAIDQFEELFSDLSQHGQYRDEFVSQLREATEAIPRLRLLVSIREDFLGRLLPYEHRIVPAGQEYYVVEPLRPDAALAAVTGPLHDTGRSFAPGVAERLVDDLRTYTLTNNLGETQPMTSEAVEPVHLQMVCAALWNGLPEDVLQISAEHVEAHADVRRALTRLCTNAVSEVAAHHGLPSSEVWTWLREQFITELGTRGVVYEGVSATAGMPNAVARELTRQHLLRVEERAGSRWYELLHDRLIEPVERGAQPWALLEEGGAQVRGAMFLRTAESALADGDLALAERYAAEAIRFGDDQTKPRTRAEAETFLAQIAAERGDLDEAAQRYRAAAASFDALGDIAAGGRVLGRLGRLLLDHGLASAAIDDLASASVRLPSDLDLRTDHARALWQAGLPQAALGVLNSALAIALDHAPALVLRGIIGAAHSSPAGALKDLDYAVRLKYEWSERPEIISARARAKSRLARSADRIAG